MADTKISALPASTTPLAGTETLPIVQSGVTKKVSVANLTAGRSTSASDFTATSGNFNVSADGKGVVAAGGVFVQSYELIPSAGTYDLTIDPSLRGFVGIASVSATRGNYNPQSTRTVFAVSAYGTTMTSTSLHTQDGSAGACAFTITCPSAGVLRVTDTSGHGSPIELFVTFSGALNFNY